MTPAETSETRLRILEVSLTLFEECGYHATAVSDIAGALGVTKAAIYYHFPSKEELLAAVVGDAADAVKDLLAMPPARTRTARTAVLEAYLDVLLEHGRVVLLLDRDVTASRQTFLRETFESVSSRVLDLLVPARGNKKGRLSAAAALGAVTRPLLVLPESDVRAARDHLLSLAQGLLDSSSSARGASATESP